MKSSLIQCLSGRSAQVALFTAIAMTLGATAAHADNLALNGSFDQTTISGSHGIGSAFGNNDDVTSWTTGGYNFVFLSGTADTTGATDPNVSLWGPGNGSNNGLPASSPDGGNYVAMDGAYEVGALSQTINGLTPGVATTVSFWYAGAQQFTYKGLTTEGIDVSLGNQTFDAPILDNVEHGFTGWQYESFTFTPDASSEVLSFLANGTPSGEPPFTLLDGVNVSQTPEPSSLALIATGLFGVGGMMRSRFKKVAVKA